MAAQGVVSVNSKNVSRSFTMALTSAILEWVLIFMLFIDAIYSYIVTKFSRYCKLQVPCLLCSRLDHVLGREKPKFYWNLICSNHKLELSSLVLCHLHNKLVDVHGMCENCLFSFALINKSNAETYRLLVGKLGEELDQDQLAQNHNLSGTSSRNCSCCNEPWILRSHAQNLLRTISVGSEGAELGMPSFIAAPHVGDEGKKRSDESSGLPTAAMGKKSSDPLSHIEYSKVKVTSDTESEVPLSDDDDGTVLIRETLELKEEFTDQFVQKEPRIITVPDDFTSEKFVYPDSAPEISLIDWHAQVDGIGYNGSKSVTSAAATRQGLDEFCCVDASAIIKLASFDDVPQPQPSNIAETPVEESAMSFHASGRDEMEQSMGTSEVEQTHKEDTSGPESKTNTTRETSPEIKPVIVDSNSQMPNNLDLGDAYKLALGTRGRQLSGKLLEQRSLKESARVSEDFKLLLTQLSGARGIDLSLDEMSPRVSGNGDEVKTDSSGSIGLHILQKRISLERNESTLSVDGSIVSEIEGESELDRFRRQIEHDKKLMSSLYKELEEERNASAVAANQAMAMITKVQEEKAALHMEALQCLRMMEEQAEYDVEALQKANDLLSEKEKEIQDLEAELELYRDKYGDASLLENKVELTYDLKDVKAKASRFENSENTHSNSITKEPHVCNRIVATKSLLLEFEDEKLYIIQCLRKLEKKLHLFSNDEDYLDMATGESVTEGGKVGQKEANFKQRTQVLHPEFVSKGSSELDCSQQCYSRGYKQVAALGDAVSNLIDRLEALEADRCSPQLIPKSSKRIDEDVDIQSRDILSPTGTIKNTD